MDDLLLACDMSTLNCKTTLFDSKGNILSYALKEYPGWKETSPDAWWKLALTTMKECLKRSTRPSDAVVGIVLTGLSGESNVMLDKDGNALMPPPRISEARQKEIFLQKKFARERVNRLQLSSTARMLCIRENWPEFFSRIYKVLSVKDYIIYKLTGRIVTDVWSIWGLQQNNVAELTGYPVEKLPEIRLPTDIVGFVKRENAEELGVLVETPVVVGGVDMICACVGTGLLKPGQAYAIIHAGASFHVISKHETLSFDPERRPWWADPTPIDYFPGLWDLISHSRAGGINLQWFRDNLGLIEIERARLRGLDAYKILDLEAERVAPGSDGLVFLPYLHGEMMAGGGPLAAYPDARGVLFGLTLAHSRAHIIRSIMEGVAYTLKSLMNVVEGEGIKVAEIRLTGGGAQSPLWRRICTDVFNKPTVSLRVKEGALMGAAVLLATGLKFYKDVPEAVKSMVHVENRYEPKDELKGMYNRGFKLYIKLCKRLGNLFPEYYAKT